MKTLSQIAEMYGVSRQAIDERVRRLGIEPRWVGKTRVWTEEQVKQLKPKRWGGNDLRQIAK